MDLYPERIEELCKNLKNTILFIVADHGHKKVEHIFLNQYKDLLDTLKTTTSIEQRATSFHIKEGKKEEFKRLFDKYFGKYFKLYTKEEIINDNLFGPGEYHPLFKDNLGDFLAIAEDSNKCFITDGDDVLVSQHAGYTDDEIYIPLIVIDKTC